MTEPAPTLTLHHGAEIPRIGLGTWPLDDAGAEATVAEGLRAGYRLIDTAHNYGNEVGVGRGVRASGLARDEVFITTKLNAAWHGVSEARDAFETSAGKLAVDYIDLFLIHWPNPDQDRYVEAFAGLVELLEAGDVRAIGLSNFKPDHIDRVIDATAVTPDVNQIELDPTVSRPGPRAYHSEHGIVTQSWSPLGKGGTLLELPAVTAIAETHNRSPAQVVLRWHLQLGCLPIPKSQDPGRMRENLDVFGFELSEDEIAALSALDRGEHVATDSDEFGH